MIIAVNSNLFPEIFLNTSGVIALNTNTKKIPECTHLSKYMASKKPICGMASPGKVKR
jgi:hypothetical protein